MGNCLGRCLSSGQNNLRCSTDEQESDELVPEEEISGDKYIFKIMKFKKKKRPQFIDQFLERQDKNYARLNEAGNNTGPIVTSSEIQLQCLDAQNLLVATTSIINQDQILSPPTTKFDHYQQQTQIGQQNCVASSSRASSSLDLEWEHEYAATLANNQISIEHNQKQSWHFLSSDELLTSSSQIINSNNYDDINNYDVSEKQQYNFYSTNNLNGSQNNIMIPIKHPGIIHLQQQINNINSNSNNNNNNINQKINFVRTPSRTSWSHISTPESLEWDIDEDQQKELHLEDDNLDHETLELLHDIEMLKNKVLNETGDGLEIKYKNS